MFGIPLTVFWLIVLALFAIIEFVTAGTLVSIWFCIGALCAWLAALSGASLTIQTILFVAVSLILLAALKPFVNKHIHNNISATNFQALIGTFGIVIEEIDNLNATGTVKADGKVWTARAEHENDIIPVGAEVKILDIRGVKLIVKEEIPDANGNATA